MTYLDRFKQPRGRPEIAIERDSRLRFARLLRELALDVSDPDDFRSPLGRTPHDFRRTAARNLIRAGVAQHVSDAAVRLENRRDVPPLCDRGRAGSQECG